ncbi:hypothetical protein ElyMa_006981600 [Elysia marginata]|uniref:Uncharacterized protein n=1 Tax=Elysia marginata TaxID=1093978 RepID=A0AAV4JLM5_9GAST|nr:hypothetical protein ElyMa_006981600 [Elysia marginata]
MLFKVIRGGREQISVWTNSPMIENTKKDSIVVIENSSIGDCYRVSSLPRITVNPCVPATRLSLAQKHCLEAAPSASIQVTLGRATAAAGRQTPSQQKQNCRRHP